MKKINWLLFCIGFPCLIVAQKNYKKAIVITAAGDTMNVLLKDKEWRVNPSEVQLKTSEDGAATIYKAADLKNIVIENGDRYYVATIKIKVTPTEFQTSYVDPKLIKTDEATIFLLQEFSSEQFSLYSLQTNNRLHLYIQKSHDTPVELIYRNLILMRGAASYETEDKTYVGQLVDLLAGCSSVADKISNSKYNVGSIIDILKKYDQRCGGKTVAYSNEKNTKGKVDYFVTVGASLTNASFKGERPDLGPRAPIITDNALKTDPSVSIGLGAMYTLPRMKQKFTFLLYIYYNSFKASITENQGGSPTPDYYMNKTVSINPSLLRTDILARYYIVKQTINPYVQAGFATSFVLSHKDELTTDTYYSGQHHVNSHDPHEDLTYKKFQMGFAIGAGVEYKRFCLDYRYESTTGFLNSLAVKSAIKANTVMIGFRINK